MLVSLNKLICENEYVKIYGSRDVGIKNITADAFEKTDSGLLILLKNDLPVSELPLDNFKAVACCTELFDKVCDTGKNLTVISVESPRKAWAFAVSRILGIDYSKTKFIGVTGTNGKSTTAEMIKCILENAGEKVGLIGTGKICISEDSLAGENYSMTTPDPPLLYKSIKDMITRECTYIVMEVSSHALCLDKTAPIPFASAVFTNISPEHLDFHSGIEDYLNTKLKLLKSSELAIFNIDDYRLNKAAKSCEISKYETGIIWQRDSYATDIFDNGLSGSSFIFRTKSFGFKVKLSLPGKFNIYNAMLALSCTIKIGIKPCVAKAAIENLKYIQGRFETVTNDDIYTVIDYAHTEAAFESLLQNLKSYLPHEKQLHIVFGCGGQRYREKRPVMAKTAEKYADMIYVTSDNSRNEPTETIFSDILQGFELNNHIVIKDREKAIFEAIINAKKGDIVAIIGKGAEKYNIDESGYHPFDEKSIIESAMRKRRKEKDESFS